jgi:hypothetical protein
MTGSAADSASERSSRSSRRTSATGRRTPRERRPWVWPDSVCRPGCPAHQGRCRPGEEPVTFLVPTEIGSERVNLTAGLRHLACRRVDARRRARRDTDPTVLDQQRLGNSPPSPRLVTRARLPRKPSSTTRCQSRGRASSRRSRRFATLPFAAIGPNTSYSSQLHPEHSADEAPLRGR